MFNVILYYSGQYGVFNDNTYKVCEDVYSIFEMLTAKYEYSFRDANCHFFRICVLYADSDNIDKYI